MKIFKEGEKSKAVCSTCKKVVPTTFVCGNYALDKSGKTVENVLQGVCDICRTTVTLPHQSMPKIRVHLKKEPKPIEARIPVHMEDIIQNIASKNNMDPQSVSNILKIVLGFYLYKIQSSRQSRNYLPAGILSDKLFSGKSTSRISLKWPEDKIELMDEIAKKHRINTSQLIKAIIITAKYDLLDDANSDLNKEFHRHIAMF